MAEQAATHHSTQVRIHLKSKDGAIELPQETGPILVSTDLKRYQLSTLVNRLLETERPIPLEFLINGQFLRTSLDEFLTQNGISAETTLNIEYVKALVPPLHIASYEQDDWISTVDILSSSSKAAKWTKSSSPIQSRLLSGSFDGSLRIWNTSQEVIATGNWHRGSIHTARFLSPTQVVSAGTDKSVHIWDYTDGLTEGSGTLKPKLELIGHKSLIDNLAVHAPSSRILTASADHTVGLWSTKKSEAPPAPEIAAPTSTNKRRKISTSSIETATRGPLSLLKSHTQDVRAVTFDEKDATVAYSASLDHSVKTWDLTTSRCVDTKTTNQSLMAICHLPSHSLIATGGALRYIDLVDLRASATKVSALQCLGHTNWIRSIARNPTNEYQFVSGSDDSTCRIWDIRSTTQEAGGGQVAKAVYVVERVSVEGKKQEQGGESTVYGVEWDEEVGIVSGGKDKRVQVNRSPGV
ncbi:related to Ribosome biogenesis protein ytm1 [Ramularia collo-cygni]|uniref:Ribosome biogenesis protein YTM1 n=1 Tax=Ramularia collo-cygni TaxID=112498 RepID=A0A2D3URA8_9PEZI|nr:related to Ribosome biogenesis protein ytm1 [Ramularia collo-cygni]CZT18481.1 related to Ribosome biogenesis protein ytm1 [Ramularia collo-cygni]